MLMRLVLPRLIPWIVGVVAAGGVALFLVRSGAKLQTAKVSRAVDRQDRLTDQDNSRIQRWVAGENLSYRQRQMADQAAFPDQKSGDE